MQEANQEPTETQQLQNKLDRLKVLGAVSGAHNLIPPNRQEDDKSRDIAIVEALSSSRRLAELYLEIRGLELDSKQKKLIQVANPIMNELGSWRFVKLIKRLSQEIEWASYGEEEMPQRIIHYYEENIPYFTFYHEDYGLNPRDFNYIFSVLQNFIDTAFHKAKQGKYINTLGRTYGEDVLKKALDTQGESRNIKREGFLSRNNPFKDL